MPCAAVKIYRVYFMEYLDTELFGQASWMQLCLLSMGEMFTRMATGAGKSFQFLWLTQMKLLE